MEAVQDISASSQERAAPGIATLKLAVALCLLYIVSYPIYALFLHPLREYPGPKLNAITRIPYRIACVQGAQVPFITRLHKTYGPTVRFAPNDLSYTESQAWKDIYTVQKGKKENEKEIKFHAPSANGTANLVTENDQARHAAVRRVFSPAFSEKALKAQEPMFQRYADLMIMKGRQAGTIDLTKLLNYTTFDIMAELAFGQSLSMLENDAYSSWVATVFQSVKVLPLLQIVQFYPLLNRIFDLLEPKFIAAMRRDHFEYTVSRVDKRIQEGSDRPDLWNLVLESNVLTKGEMHVNAELFMIAGTETTVLTDEIRGRFKSNEDITFEGLVGLEYLNACLKEGLRVYPSLASAIPREIAQGGNSVLGKWLPGGTRVSVHQFATYRSPANVRNPDTFAPERWLGDPEYKDDIREVHQPFSTGPRNCMGMNMAWHEMRLLFGKLLYNFDIGSDVGPEWLDQNTYVIWDRKPLVCRLKSVTD
ncbi:cytochrome P450 [Xylariales sp. AK1849]|nr:cytochrome P450 [Xylariales sp. AK1849]